MSDKNIESTGSTEGWSQDLERRVAEATQELQRAKERAEEANRVKAQFLAAASHDLRQPLQAVGLLVGSLRLRNKDPDAGLLIERIERALGSVEGVLDALLDISRLDAGGVEPRLARFPAANLLHALQETFGATASQLSVDLRVRSTALWCESDPLLLERILSNLLWNALRYSDKGRVLVGCRPRGATVCFEVRDNGGGIAEEHHKTIFREFVQLEESARLRDQGLGLGLAIVERLAALLGHEVWLRSRKGQGSTFGVMVPRAVPAPAPALAQQTQARMVDLAGARILVLEEDEEVLAALGLLLSQHGAVPLLARTIAHALSLAGAALDLVIADDRLAPGDHRIPAIRELRAQFAAGVPRVILAGQGLPQAGAGAPGGSRIIRKPVSSDELLRAVEAALENR